MRPTLLFCWLVLLALQMSAQEIRVTPEALPDFNLSSDFFMQSAAGNRGSFFAAWGTSERRGGDTVGILVGQAVVDRQPVGEPRRLHGEAARPFGAAGVVVIDSSVGVIWNDRRVGGEGVYLRRFTREGVPLEEEQRLSDLALSESGGVRYIGNDTLPRLVWRGFVGSDTVYLSVDLPAPGRQPAPPVRVRTIDFDDTVALLHLPGSTIRRLDSATFRFETAAGPSDPRTIHAPLSHGRFLIGADTSLLVLTSESYREVRLTRWRSLFDESPVSTRVLEIIPDSSTDSLLPHATAMSRDSAGRLVVTVLASARISGSLLLRTYQALLVDESASTVVVTMQRSDVVGTDGYVCESGQTVFGGPSGTKGDIGWWRIEVSARVLKGSGESSHRTVLVDPLGRVVKDIDLFRAREAVAFAGAGSEVLAAFRRAGGLGSAIDVIAGTDTVRLTAPMAPTPWLLRNLTPIAIPRSDGSVWVYWRSHEHAPTFQSAVVRNGPTPLIERRPGFTPDGLGNARVPIPGYDEAYNFDDWTTYALHRRSLIAVWGYGRYTRGGQVVSGSTRYRLIQLVDSGFRILLPVVSRSLTQPVAVWSTSVDGTEIVGHATPIIFHRSAGLDTLARHSLEIPGSHQIAALGNRRAILLAPDRMYVIIDSLGHSEPIVPDVSGSVWFVQPLDHSSALRCFYDPVPKGVAARDSTLRLQRFDWRFQSSGVSLHLPTPTMPRSVAVIPRTGRVIVPYGSENGVRLTILSDSLRVLVADTLVAAAGVPVREVSAEVSGDMLLLAWEDHRFGGTDVFTTSWRIPPELLVAPAPDSTGDHPDTTGGDHPDTTGGDHPDTTGGDHPDTTRVDGPYFPPSDTTLVHPPFPGISPNPSRGSVVITFERGEESGRVRLYDLRGGLALERTLSEAELSSGRAVLDCTRLPTGTFELELLVDDRRMLERVVLLPR